MKHRIEQIIVVEGRDDESAVKAALDAEVIVTGGFHIRKETWERIEKACRGPGVIVFTDPDFAGESIRKRIKDRFPQCRHAFLSREEASKNGDVGIENASPQAIEEALKKAKCTLWQGTAPFSMEDLDFFGLSGSLEAAARRSLLGKALGIGSANAKTFLARLNGYGITREEFYRNGQALFTGHREADHQ